MAGRGGRCARGRADRSCGAGPPGLRAPTIPRAWAAREVFAAAGLGKPVNLSDMREDGPQDRHMQLLRHARSARPRPRAPRTGLFKLWRAAARHEGDAKGEIRPFAPAGTADDLAPAGV